MFPLDILPSGIVQALQFTPFPYQMYFPVSLYLGKIRHEDVLAGLMIQSAWVVAMYGLARFMWLRGLRKYSAVGG
jgi:ABC-2 type transport system permease protein